MKKISIFIISILALVAIAFAVEVPTGIVYVTNSSADPNGTNGVLFTPNQNVTLTNITKSGISTAPNCLVIGYASNISLGQGTFIGNNCALNVTLVQNVTYRIGTNYSILGGHRSTSNGGVTWPINTAFGSYVGGYFGNQDNLSALFNTLNSTAYDIQNISVFNGTVVLPGQVFVQLISPPNNSVTISPNVTFIANVSVVNNATLAGGILHVWNSTGFLINTTTQGFSASNTSAIFNQTVYGLGFGTYLWNIRVLWTNSSGPVVDFYTGNFTFSRANFDIIGESFPSLVYDTDDALFEINVSLDPTVEFFSATFNYSGTSYIVKDINEITPGFFNLKSEIDIPAVSANTTVNFNWIINVDLGGSFNSIVTNQSQTLVSVTNLTNNSINSIISKNYTIFDEETLLPIFSNFDATHEWYLGNGNETKNNSFDLIKSGSFYFYITPTTEEFKVSSTIAIFNGTQTATGTNVSYENRIFDFVQEIFNNVTSNQSLYLLPSTNGTEFIINLKDTGLSPLPNHLIKISRYYPAENKFRMVESRLTDSFGQISARLIINTVRYRVDFYDEQNRLVKTEDNVYFTCKNVVCVAEFIIEDDSDPFGLFTNLTNYEYTLSFNNDTNTISFVWNDNTGDSSIHNLQVTRYLFNGTTTMCNQNSSVNLGIISCSLGDLKASYKADAFRWVDGESRRIDTLTAEVGDESGTFGVEGLMWSFILLMTMITLGIFYPPAGIILYLLMVFFLGSIDIIYLPPALIITQIVIGVVFIWAWRG